MLSLAHRQHLRNEGFTDSQIAQHLEPLGVRSVAESEARSLKIVCKDDSGEYRSSSGIYFPFTKSFGQLRCDNPPVRNGKLAKYPTPAQELIEYSNQRQEPLL